MASRHGSPPWPHLGSVQAAQFRACKICYAVQMRNERNGSGGWDTKLESSLNIRMLSTKAEPDQ